MVWLAHFDTVDLVSLRTTLHTEVLLNLAIFLFFRFSFQLIGIWYARNKQKNTLCRNETLQQIKRGIQKYKDKQTNTRFQNYTVLSKQHFFEIKKKKQHIHIHTYILHVNVPGLFTLLLRSGKKYAILYNMNKKVVKCSKKYSKFIKRYSAPVATCMVAGRSILLYPSWNSQLLTLLQRCFMVM